MDELSAFKNAPPELAVLEESLLKRADVVFTGGHSLYEAKKHLHHNVHAMPSSVDAKHFASARSISVDPADQRELPRPRLGFFGVLDERLDLAATARDRRGPPGVATGDDWTGGQDRSRGLAAATQHSLPRREAVRRAAGIPGRLGSSPCCCSPAMRQRASSARPRPRNTWPRASPSSRPRFATSSRPYGDRDLVRIADTVEDFIHACAKRLARGPGAAPRSRRRVPARHLVGSHLGEDSCAVGRRHRSSTRASAENRGFVRIRAGILRTAMFDYLIVGAGFAGATIAERLAAHAGQARADLRQAAAYRRQRLRLLR